VSTPPGQATAPASNQVTLAQIMAQSQAASNSIMGASPSAPGGKMSDSSPIYMGKVGTTSPFTREGVVQQKDQTLTYDQARLLPGDWYQNDPDQLKKLVNTGILNKVPGFQAGMGIGDIISAWDELVKTSFQLNQRTGSEKRWTPWDVLNTYSNPKGTYGEVKQGDWMVDAATGEKVKYVGPKSKTTTSRDVNLSSAEDVKALTTQVLTQALGRAPTSKEVAQYKSTINAQEAANPTITTSTQNINDRGEVASQNSTTSGGFDAAAQAQVVQDQASQSPEFAKYQSGTTYWNAMMQMLTGSASTGG